jgi:hypothetical protein
VDAQIKHSSRKLQNSQKIQEQVGNDAERQLAKLHSLRRDLANARQAADEAAGKPFVDVLYSFFNILYAQRPTDVHLNITLPSARKV